MTFADIKAPSKTAKQTDIGTLISRVDVQHHLKVIMKMKKRRRRVDGCVNRM